MRVVVVEEPKPIVTVDEAKLHLRVDDAGEDALISGLIAAATAHIDGPEGWLGRAIGIQTLEARFDVYEAVWDLLLPCPPVVELVEMSWLGADRGVQSGDIEAVELIGARVVPIADAPWSGLRIGAEVLRVVYRAGYDVVPAPLRAAVLLMVGDLYRNRSELTSAPVSAVPMQASVQSLLSPFKVWR